MVAKSYLINKKTYSQGLLTAKQAFDLIELIEDLDFESSNIISIAKKLYKSGKIVSILNVILKGEKPLKANVLETLPLTVIVKVVQDFFSFNNIWELIQSHLQT